MLLAAMFNPADAQI